MSKDEILAALAVLALAGAIIFVWGNKPPEVAASIAHTGKYEADLEATGDNMDAFNYGPSIYVASTPYLFQVALGNIVPPLTAPDNGTIAAQQIAAVQTQCLGCQG